jgi:N-acyl-D-aspartate/D-glutamate deacylase
MENEKINNKLNAIANQEKVINSNSKHTKNGKTNWAMYGTFIQSSKQLKVLRLELSQLRKEKDENIKKAVHTAGAQQSKMMGGVIVSLLLMLLSNWGLSGYNVRTASAQHAHPEQTVKITASDKEVNEELKAVNEYKERSLSQLEIDLIDGLSIRKSSAKHNIKDWEVRQIRKELIDGGYIS